MTAKTRRTMMILPLCLLFLNILQEVMIYQVRDAVPNPHLRVGILLATFAIGFTAVGHLLAPWLVSVFETGHKVSKKQGGVSGVAVFYTVTLIAIYAAYFVIYVRGPQFLLPPSWR